MFKSTISLKSPAQNLAYCPPVLPAAGASPGLMIDPWGCGMSHTWYIFTGFMGTSLVPSYIRLNSLLLLRAQRSWAFHLAGSGSSTPSWYFPVSTAQAWGTGNHSECLPLPRNTAECVHPLSYTWAHTPGPDCPAIPIPTYRGCSRKPHPQALARQHQRDIKPYANIIFWKEEPYLNCWCQHHLSRVAIIKVRNKEGPGKNTVHLSTIQGSGILTLCTVKNPHI